jgi:hypothetical protein
MSYTGLGATIQGREAAEVITDDLVREWLVGYLTRYQPAGSVSNIRVLSWSLLPAGGVRIEYQADQGGVTSSGELSTDLGLRWDAAGRDPLEVVEEIAQEGKALFLAGRWPAGMTGEDWATQEIARRLGPEFVATYRDQVIQRMGVLIPDQTPHPVPQTNLVADYVLRRNPNGLDLWDLIAVRIGGGPWQSLRAYNLTWHDVETGAFGQGWPLGRAWILPDLPPDWVGTVLSPDAVSPPVIRPVTPPPEVVVPSSAVSSRGPTGGSEGTMIPEESHRATLWIVGAAIAGSLILGRKRGHVRRG